ncbi:MULTISPECIES: response regulator transcription factor [Streptomycetaceae]|uniref:Putative two-component system response regulator n=1 Tax=Streptantibioticus cattleyicolor (strain ATCC 35852 / DSM 46488 / JCM 4925 / NBRC 14057 / NRRL 8057) TaxID=1003195 RepID=F8JZH0_STREN|nr:response regulator transcription factor [Streptantibioticus cattleyicolor]AEW97271.1 putative two-component system response regulator [Streptantibioticus cattleyicolor NRRL 8057 = DSM 46488]MYS61724.1 response regulator [Streptomyces sp. SID5468]CCB77592.1 Uncharacterized transcriptional regulatory protein yxjL [Streptantibioticus cattleyicolor NRRL 8057 = DSM 46488]
MTVRVVLADDEAMVRGALRAILECEPDLTVAGEAASGAEVVPLVRQVRPDVVLMDVRMPEVDGIRATERLVSSMTVPPRILVVTTFENDAYVYQALRAGAAGFLLKRADAGQLVSAVRLVAAGDCLLFPAAVGRLAARYAPAEGAGRRLRERLTERECEVLRLMARGLANGEIAARLRVGPETVKTHVARVLAKLGARDRTQAVITAYESGFVMPSAGWPRASRIEV